LLYKAVTTTRPTIEEIKILKTGVDDKSEAIWLECEFDAPLTDSVNDCYPKEVKEWF
jgi:hypothetical protein